MPDYDLRGLSTRSFEKLVQALAGQVLGLGTVTFGDGPDGGREATFDGRMNYPSTADLWEGYCVIQAKFLQRPRGTRSDGHWAYKQLESELKAFADAKKKRRRPDYYVFATNVVLSPVQDRGTKDRLSLLLARYRKKLSLRGWSVWDYDEIGRFLDTYGDIRRANAAWITPGDVLSKVMEQLGLNSQSFLDVMTNFLAKELRSDQYANLEQAGHTADERIPLARVFVDLPTTLQRFSEPPPETHQHESPVVELLATLIEKAKDPLDPASVAPSHVYREKGTGRTEGPQPGRYVLARLRLKPTRGLRSSQTAWA